MVAKWLVGSIVMGLLLLVATSSEEKESESSSDRTKRQYQSNPTYLFGNYYTYYCPKVAGHESHCRPTKDCALWYDAVLATPGTACKLPDGSPGACCPRHPSNSIMAVFPPNKVVN